MLNRVFSESQFASGIQRTGQTLVVFGASGCGSCSTYRPVVRRFGMKHTDVYCLYLDVDDWVNIADEYKIKYTPTTFLFRAGSVVKHKAGHMGLEVLERWVSLKT